MATSTNDGASAPAPAVVPPGDSEMLAGTPSFDVISNYKGWIASKEYRDASAEIAKRMEDEGVEGVYFVCPSLDGRPVGKFVATNSFEGIANKGMNLHPMALTDFRADIFGNPIGFVEEDREGVMVPDLSTFRVFPWQPKLARVFCFYYDGESGDMRGIDARGTLARHEHTFKEEVGADMFVGIEPELMWLRRKDDGELEHTVNPLAFYEIAFIEEWEPLLLDLIEYGRGMGVTVTHADSEDKSQIELNQQPMSPLAYVDNFYTYRQLCRIVARKHGMIATFMPKPFMGVSANGHHHSLSIMNEAGENLLSGDMKGDCRLSEDGVHLLGGLIEHADAATLIGAPTANSYKRFWDVGLWAPFHNSYGFDNRACLFRVRPTPTIEARGIDASCNPYLTVSACLVTGLDGIRNKIDPGDPVQGNVMHDLTIPREERIPITLTEAIEAFQGDDLMKEIFQKEMYDTFVGLRTDDLQRYWSHVSEWERDFYLERWP
jgi:glutamine synthetase